MNEITLVFRMDSVNLEEIIIEVCERLKAAGGLGAINRLPGETETSPFLIVLESSDDKDIFCQICQIVQDGSRLKEDRLLLGKVADKIVALGGYLTIEIYTRNIGKINIIYDIIQNLVKEFKEVYWLSMGELLPLPSRKSFQGMCAGRGCIL